MKRVQELRAVLRRVAPHEDPLELRRIIAKTRSRLLANATVLRLGRYELQERIGTGSFGLVYRAFDPRTRRDVALKVQHGEVTARLGARAPIVLRREARALAALNHPNVATALDFGFSSGRWFVVMELVPGEPAGQWLRRGGRSLGDRMRIVEQTADAVHAIHAQGLVHCDLKPHNIIVTDDGNAKLIDFGLATTQASLRRANQRVGGTPMYAAPEQLTRGPVDARADQYSLAVVSAELLTGAPSHHANTLLRTPEGEVIPERTVREIERALAEDPALRHPDVLAFRRALSSRPTRMRPRWIAAIALLGSGLGWLVPTARICDGPAFTARFELDAEALERVASRLEDGELRQAWQARSRHYRTALLNGATASCQVDDPSTMACLSRQRDAAAFALEQLEQLDDAELRTSAPTQPAFSVDPSCGTEGPKSPQLIALQRALAEVDLLVRFRKLDDAERRLRGLQPLLAQHGDAKTRADTLAMRSDIALDRGEVELSIELLEQGLWTAVQGGDPETTVLLATLLGTRITDHRGDPARAAQLNRLAWSSVQRAGSPPELQGRYWMAEAMRARAAGSAQFELEAATRALAAFDQSAVDPGWLVFANLASAQDRVGAYEDAHQTLGRGLALVADDIEAQSTLLTLRGSLWFRQAQVDRGVADYQRAIALAEKFFGPDHWQTFDVRSNFGAALVDVDPERAVPILERGLAAYERVQPNSVGALYARINLANALLGCGELERAEVVALDAVTLADTLSGAPLVELTTGWAVLAQIREAAGKQELARAAYRQAKRRLRDEDGPQADQMRVWLDEGLEALGPTDTAVSSIP